MSDPTAPQTVTSSTLMAGLDDRLDRLLAANEELAVKVDGLAAVASGARTGRTVLLAVVLVLALAVYHLGVVRPQGSRLDRRIDRLESRAATAVQPPPTPSSTAPSSPPPTIPPPPGPVVIEPAPGAPVVVVPPAAPTPAPVADGPVIIVPAPPADRGLVDVDIVPAPIPPAQDIAPTVVAPVIVPPPPAVTVPPVLGGLLDRPLLPSPGPSATASESPPLLCSIDPPLIDLGQMLCGIVVGE